MSVQQSKSSINLLFWFLAPTNSKKIDFIVNEVQFAITVNRTKLVKNCFNLMLYV